MQSTPASLLERLRRPNPTDAWRRFTELYTPLLYYWVRRQGIQQADAADVVQEVFVILIVKMPEFNYDVSRSFRNWLRTITLNKVREFQRKCRSTQFVAAALENLPDADASDAFWETEYRQQLIDRALNVIKTDFESATWEAFWQHGVVGRPAPQVAAELQITAGAVRAARFRVLARLRQELSGLLD